MLVPGGFPKLRADRCDLAAGIECGAVNLEVLGTGRERLPGFGGEGFDRDGRKLMAVAQGEVCDEAERAPVRFVGLGGESRGEQAGEVDHIDCGAEPDSQCQAVDRIGNREDLAPGVGGVQSAEVPCLPVRGEEGGVVGFYPVGDSGESVAEREPGGILPAGAWFGGCLCQDGSGGLDGEDRAQQTRHAPRRQFMARFCRERSECDQILGELFGRGLGKRLQQAPGLRHKVWNGDREFVASTELVDEDRFLGVGCERVPPRHLDEKGEAVGERGVEWLRTMVGGLVVGILVRRRVHRRPAVTEFFETDPLDAPLMDDGKELVLEFRARAADFIDENHLRVPDR